MPVTSWSTTTALNVVSGGVSGSGGSGIQGSSSLANGNDAIQEIMSQIATFITAATFTGTSPVTLTSTDAGATSGPVLTIYRDSASPAANDSLGQIVFQGRDSAGVATAYADILNTLIDPTDGSEDGQLAFRAMVAGTLTEHLKISGGITTVVQKEFRVGNSVVTMGCSGGDYGSVGYNIDYTDVSGSHNYIVSDYASLLFFTSGGMELKTAPSGTGGASATLTSRLAVSQAGVLRVHGLGAGTVTTNSSGEFSVSSDAALKDFIAPFNRGLDDLRAIGGPDTYRWLSEVEALGDDAPVYAGFSAQKVQLGIPEAVMAGPDGKLALQDRPIIAALVNAVLALEDRIAVLEASVAP